MKKVKLHLKTTKGKRSTIVLFTVKKSVRKSMRLTTGCVGVLGQPVN